MGTIMAKLPTPIPLQQQRRPSQFMRGQEQTASSETESTDGAATYVTKRPARIAWYPAVMALAWMTTPSMNTEQATRMPYFREMASARKPDNKVPIQAPSTRKTNSQPFFVWSALGSVGSYSPMSTLGLAVSFGKKTRVSWDLGVLRGQTYASGTQAWPGRPRTCPGCSRRAHHRCRRRRRC